ncbi:hypothetical protein [Nocardia pseudovaccinii]|uniref:hypothetical protein n=1 Tax=Nocardia pseudovaccinii TaxID=189540 RepID=UPI0012F4A0DD|nr:hypothetical protein [Nocardia pseudovaccinii]
MSNTTTTENWSPADSPVAIAVSEAYWWQSTIMLEIRRLRDDPDRRVRVSSHQIDARQLVFALRQLITAATLMEDVAAECGAARVVTGMAGAIQRFKDALPGVKDMRDGLMHFENWSRGTGRGPQAKRARAKELREIARDYWLFAFDREADTLSMGPYGFSGAAAEQAARDLYGMIYEAGRVLDTPAGP